MDEKNYLFSINMHGRIHTRYGSTTELIRVYDASHSNNRTIPADKINLVQIYEITTDITGKINFSQIPISRLEEIIKQKGNK